jgi:hypothetical protein
MGLFGSGLYVGDLPWTCAPRSEPFCACHSIGDRLVEILSERETAAAHNSDDEDHTTFWLVIADQFAKRAIACERVRTKTLYIIDTGADIAMLEKLGMKPADLRKRQRMLDELRSRIVSGPANQQTANRSKSAPTTIDGDRRRACVSNLRRRKHKSVLPL